MGVFERPLTAPTVVSGVAVLVVGAGLAALIWAAVQQALRALTGFGIPLSAVTWPTLVLGRPADRIKNELVLTRKSLLVAPQQAIRAAITNRPGVIMVDLAAELLPASNDALRPVPPAVHPAVPRLWKRSMPGTRPHLVVIGLELILRDAARRRATLAYLERAVEALAPGAANGLAEIVIIVDMSPLERILDAFETQDDSDNERETSREELRWARLFQDFTTFSFAPIDKLGRFHRSKRACLTAPSRTLAEELRWLPGNVIDGVIADHGSRDLAAKPAGVFPIRAWQYQAHYGPRIVAWARAVEPVTEVAAIDFLRANLIEYYEQCWAASSLSERLVLDAIARSGFVNMRKAIALQSLVRRGLVILDPAPRLMNDSFGLFIRQHERPDSLQAWKEKQARKSAWANVKLPLAIAIPALVLMLAFAAAEIRPGINGDHLSPRRWRASAHRQPGAVTKTGGLRR